MYGLRMGCVGVIREYLEAQVEWVTLMMMPAVAAWSVQCGAGDSAPASRAHGTGTGG